MNAITYKKLTLDNFNKHSLDSFRRYQVMKEILKKIDGQYIYADNPFTDDWSIEKCQSVAEDIIYAINKGAITYGAFYGDRVIGFAYLGTEYFGSQKQYLELEIFQVSYEFRNKGIGKELFKLVCNDAKKSGAKKLYISAHPSKESQEAYRHLGCTFAEEINQQLAENEPDDIQMECTL